MSNKISLNKGANLLGKRKQQQAVSVFKPVKKKKSALDEIMAVSGF